MPIASRLIAAVGLAWLALAPVSAPASAQPVATRVRGTIASIDGQSLVVTGRSSSVPVALAANLVVNAVSEIKLADIKPGSFIGTAAVPEPDGSLRALEVHVFPESMRGTGEGNRPWDFGPQSSMTNGTVGRIEGADGRKLTVEYPGGAKTVTVPDDVPVVAYEMASRDLLRPGASVVVIATKAEDGAMHADRVIVATGNAKLGM